MVPGSLKKTKAKRSCTRVRRMQMKPGDYHKVKLKTASGGSLTIRYRKTLHSLTPGSCCSGESSSGEAEASSSHGGSDQSFTENSLDDNQAFENLEDLLEYSQSCVSGAPADGCDAVYRSGMQPDFSYHFGSSDDCNSSDIGSNDVPPELITTDNIGQLPTASPIVMNENFLEELAETACATFEDTQCYSLEQSSMLIQQLTAFSSQGVEIASELVCMEAYENLAGANVCSIDRAGYTNLEEGRLMQSCGLPFISLPPLLDQTESSEIELIDLPPLLRYETADTICAQESTLHERYEHSSENLAAGCMSLKEDAEIFNEDSFLLLDPGMPDEVNLNMNIGDGQSPWSALLENTLHEVAEEPAQEQSTAAKEAGKSSITKPQRLKESFADKLSIKQNFMATWEDNIPSGFELTLPAASDQSMDQDCLLLSDPVATRGKKLRKKRLRRATPLNTLRSLLSSRDEPPPIQHQRRIPSSATETNSQDFYDDTLGSEVTKCSNDVSPAKRFVESTMFRQLDSGNAPKGRVAHPELTCNWRTQNDPHQVYRSVHDIHNSASYNSRMHKGSTPCTSSEDEMANQASVIASSQRSYQETVIAPRRRISNQETGKSARRPDGRGRPRCSSLLPERAVATLRKWFDDHIAFPFADKEQKLDLVSQTGLTLTQVENWLSNYRHRLKVRRSDYEGTVFRPEKAWTRH